MKSNDSNLEEQTGTIGVFLVDPNVLFRQGVYAALAEFKNIRLLGDADIGHKDILEIIEQFSPKVVLVDVNMPLFNGLDLTRMITQRLPQTLVIVLTPYEEENQLFQAIKAGAVAYLGKSIAPKELANIITRVSSGEHVITESLLTKPRVAERVLRQFQDLALAGIAMETLAIPLTARELEVLTHVARGYKNKQIAHILSINEQTIKNHITAILRKLDANNRTHAVVLAMRHGWISMSERKEPPRQ